MKQAFHYNKTAKNLPILHEGDTLMRMKPFQLGQNNCGKAIVNKRLDERSFEVETNSGIGPTDETESTFYESRMRNLQTYTKDKVNQAIIEQRDVMIERRNVMIERRDTMIERRDAMIERWDAMIERRDAMIELRDTMIERRDTMIERRDAMIERRDVMIERRDVMIERRDAMIERRDVMIERRDAMIERRDVMIERVVKRWTKAKQWVSQLHQQECRKEMTNRRWKTSEHDLEEHRTL